MSQTEEETKNKELWGDEELDKAIIIKSCGINKLRK